MGCMGRVRGADEEHSWVDAATSPRHPLRGVTVVDLTTSYAGPTATMYLADLGAEVVKIERPRTGDDARGWGPPFVGGGQSAWFASANRNKRSVCLDLASPGGREVLDRLLAGAQVFIQNLSPGKLPRLGLEPDRVAARHPHLIYCAVSGFGLSGPDRELPGYDLIAQARSGLMSVTGAAGGSPQRVSTALSDVATGMIAAFSIVAALRHQEATGEGTVLDVALLDVDLALMAPRIASYLAGEPEPRPSGATDSVLAVYQGFEAADRTFVVAIGNDPMWQRLCAGLGLDELGADPELADNDGRRRRRPELIARLSAIFATAPADHWLQVLRAEGIPCSLVRTLSEVVVDDHLRERGAFVDLPLGDGSTATVVDHPWRVHGPSAGTGPPAHEPPPATGADTARLLVRLGYDDDEVRLLHEEGAVWSPSF